MNIFRTSPGISPKIKLETSKPSTSEPNVKKVTPRLKQLAYGEVLTTEDVLNRIKQKEEKSRKKSGGKRKRSITKLPIIVKESQKVMKLKR